MSANSRFYNINADCVYTQTNKLPKLLLSEGLINIYIYILMFLSLVQFFKCRTCKVEFVTLLLRVTTQLS